MEVNSFLLESAELEFEKPERYSVSFLSPKADRKSTHISLIVGANGTSKSRILASLVEQFCDIKDQQTYNASQRKYPTSGTHGLLCTQLSTIGNGQSSHYAAQKNSKSKIKQSVASLALPSRILVLSNLVVDKFHFPKSAGDGRQFYHYLGVRQSTNMMTSGSMDRAVTEALLSIALDHERLASFQEWVALIFSGTRELALQFPRLKISAIEKYLALKDKKEFLSERMQRRNLSDQLRSLPIPSLEDTEEKVTALFHYLLSKLTVNTRINREGRNETQAILRLASITGNEKIKLSELPMFFAAVSGALKP